MNMSRDAAGGFPAPMTVARGDDGAVWPRIVGERGVPAPDVIEAILEGGPNHLPAGLRTQRVTNDNEKIKVPYNGGYEHFERDCGAAADGAPIIFRWTGRTRIAE